MLRAGHLVVQLTCAFDRSNTRLYLPIVCVLRSQSFSKNFITTAEPLPEAYSVEVPIQDATDGSEHSLSRDFCTSLMHKRQERTSMGIYQKAKFLQSWFRGTPFRSLLQGGLKGLKARKEEERRSESRRRLHLRRLQGGFNRA